MFKIFRNKENKCTIMSQVVSWSSVNTKQMALLSVFLTCFTAVIFLVKRELVSDGPSPLAYKQKSENWRKNEIKVYSSKLFRVLWVFWFVWQSYLSLPCWVRPVSIWYLNSSDLEILLIYLLEVFIQNKFSWRVSVSKWVI